MPVDRRDLVLTDSERRIALRAITGFDRLSAEELAAIAQHTQMRQFAAGETLVHPSRPRTSIHFLVSGDLRIVRGGRAWPDASPLLDLFWLARDSVPLEVTTRGGALTLEIPTAELEDVLDEHFPIVLETARSLAARLLELAPPPADVEVLRFHRRSRASAFTERLTLLREGLEFAGGRIETIAQLAESAVELRFEAGATVWRAGDPARVLLVPVEGAVRAAPHDVLGPLGLLEMLADRPRPTTLEVVESLTALAIDRESFLDVLEDHHALARDFLAIAAAVLIRRQEVER